MALGNQKPSRNEQVGVNVPPPTHDGRAMTLVIFFVVMLRGLVFAMAALLFQGRVLLAMAVSYY